MPPYRELYPVGTQVQVADRASLEEFARTWRYHNKLQPAQLEYAATGTTVASVGYYHGGDVLYELEGVPGVWHEGCIHPSTEVGAV
jgi:hypothetical protein